MDESIGDRISQAGRKQKEWRKEFTECHAFYAGHQWNNADKDILDGQSRPAVTFNRIQPLVDSVTGFQVTNKQEIRYQPRGQEDGLVVEMLNRVADWIRDQSYADDEESHAFEDAVIGGMGWTETRMDYDDDPEGRVTVEHIPALEMRWDEKSRRKNLQDAQWIARIKKYTRDELEEAFGEEIADNINASRIEDGDLYEAESDEGDDYRSEDWGYNEDTGHYVVAHYQECYYANQYRVGNPLTGRVEDLTEEQWSRVGQRVEEMGLKYVRRRLKKYRQYFAAGGEVWDETDIPGFTFCAITGKYDHLERRFYGVVRSLIDPQRWNNKLYSEMLHIINTNAKGGVLVEEGAVENQHKFEDEWASADSVTWLRNGALSQGKVQPKPPANYPSSLDKLLQHSVTAIGDVSAISPEFIGMANRDQAGVLEVERKKAALVVLAGLFDGIKRYRKVQGRLLLHYISKFIPDSQITRVVGQQLAQFIPQLRSPNVLRYDVAVDTAPESPNQKQEIWAILQQILPPLLSAGIPVPPSLVRYLPLPETVTREWQRYIEQSTAPKGPDPVEQAMVQNAQAQTQETLAQVEERKTKAKYNQAAAAEKAAKAVTAGQQAIQQAALHAVRGI